MSAGATATHSAAGKALEMVANPNLQRLIPAPVGARLSPSQGEVLAVFGHYGWLTTPHKIDHPAAAKTSGQIYFRVRDVVDNVSLVEGDRVNFYLYVDEQGLGAEQLSLQRWDAGQRSARVAMNPGAAEFVPSAYSIPPDSSVVDRARPLGGFVFNSAYWSDDSDTDSSVESEIDQRGYWTDASHGDDSATERHSRRRSELQRRLRKKKTQVHSHASSSTGSPSDSERSALDGATPGSLHLLVRPPSGLRPPPGLLP